MGLTGLCVGLMTDPTSAQEVSFAAPTASETLQDRLRANALLLRDSDEPRGGQDILAAARADYGRLIGVLYEEGHFAPVIRISLDGRDAARMSPFAAPNQVSQVQITVDPGPVFSLGNAEIGPLAPNASQPEGFTSGSAASTTVLRTAAREAIEGWRQAGHATAGLAGQRITARNAEARLDAEIRIAPGPRLQFGTLLPQGQNRMRPDRIRDIAGLPSGETYSPDSLARAEERLRDSGAFSAVQLEDGSVRNGDVIDIAAALDEAPLRRFGFGFEIASDDGISGSAYWLHRNLFGGAERLRFDAEISGLGASNQDPDIRLGARFDRPATITPDTLFTAEFFAFDLDDPQYELAAIGIGARLSDRLSEQLSGSIGVGLSYSDMRDGLGARNVTLFNLPLELTYDNRDEPLDARSGGLAALEVTPFYPLGSDPGLRLWLEGRGYFGFGAEDRTRLASRLQLGSVSGASLAETPLDYLFFSGGSGTVRGQEFQSLGSVQNGVSVGGRSFAGLSAELRHDIGDTDFGIVGFADIGMITADAFGGGASDWHAGAGFGIRYDTPFGPIRVDLATPISDGRAGDDLYLYIGIGQSF